MFSGRGGAFPRTVPGCDDFLKFELEEITLSTSASTRLFAILAQEKATAIILRRGPSKEVLLISWNLDDDSLHFGQWFRGRIYERRCDLSPSGDLFIYFAAKYRGPMFSWTAVSKPPYLTALALWPKGDGWGGGGIFRSETSINLNHGPSECTLSEALRLDNRLEVNLFGDSSGMGEDYPLYDSLLEKRGWKLIEEGEVVTSPWDAKVRHVWTIPRTYQKGSIAGNVLLQQIRGLGIRDGESWWMDYQITDANGEQLLRLPRIDWADWDHNGDLLFADMGCIFRLRTENFSKIHDRRYSAAKLVANLNRVKWEYRAAPREARTW